MNLSRLSIAGTDKSRLPFRRDAGRNSVCVWGVNTLFTSFGFLMVNNSLVEPELELKHLTKRVQCAQSNPARGTFQWNVSQKTVVSEYVPQCVRSHRYQTELVSWHHLLV